MTIDDAIKELEILKKNTFSYMSAHQAFITAVNIMRKYQQIEQIYKEWFSDTGHTSAEAYTRIGEVLRDEYDG